MSPSMDCPTMLDKYLEVTVQDTGIGISEEDHDKLFKLGGFRKELDQQNNTRGFGLGLTISQLIVNQFNGKITFKSKVGEGSTFTFSFKLETERFELGSGEEEELQQEYRLNSTKLQFLWVPTLKEQDPLCLIQKSGPPGINYINDLDKAPHPLDRLEFIQQNLA